MADHRGERGGVLPRQRLQLERVKGDPLTGLRRVDQETCAVAGVDLADPDLRELVGDHDRLALGSCAGTRRARPRPHGSVAVLGLALPFQAHRKIARFWVRSTDSSTAMWRRAKRQLPASLRSRSRAAGGDRRAGSITSPRLRNRNTADSTISSSSCGVANVRRLTGGAGGAKAGPRSRRAPWRIERRGGDSEYLSSSKCAMRLRGVVARSERGRDPDRHEVVDVVGQRVQPRLVLLRDRADMPPRPASGEPADAGGRRTASDSPTALGRRGVARRAASRCESIGMVGAHRAVPRRHVGGRAGSDLHASSRTYGSRSRQSAHSFSRCPLVVLAVADVSDARTARTAPAVSGSTTAAVVRQDAHAAVEPEPRAPSSRRRCWSGRPSSPHRPARTCPSSRSTSGRPCRTAP